MKDESMKRLSFLASLLLTLLLAGAAHAQPVGTPKERIDTMYTAVKAAVMKADNHDALVTEVTGLLDGMIDYDGFASRTLKTSWPTLTAAQRTKFIEKFKQLVIRTYAKRFTPKTEFTVSWRAEPMFTNTARTEAKAQTTVHGKKVSADVDYAMIWSDAKKAWLALDFVIDDVSMSLNWRGQFEKIIAKEGFDALITKIEKKVQKGGDE